MALGGGGHPQISMIHRFFYVGNKWRVFHALPPFFVGSNKLATSWDN